MQSQTHLRLSPAVRFAQAVNRMLTWGMLPEEREVFLTETLADWEAMAKERPGASIIWRTARGIPATVWIRLNRREITAMPAGIALTLVGAGCVAAATQTHVLPNPFRSYIIVAALGLVLVGINFVRQPNMLTLSRYRLPAALGTIGFAGLAMFLPTAAHWPYEAPLVENVVIDRGMQLSFVVIALGFSVLIVASLGPSPAPWVRRSGLVLMLGVAMLALTVIAWGITMSPVDMTMTAASLVVGLAALSFVHVLPRLRHLEIIYSRAESGRLGGGSLRKGKA